MRPLARQSLEEMSCAGLGGNIAGLVIKPLDVPSIG
jgi:hypothetical protein